MKIRKTVLQGLEKIDTDAAGERDFRELGRFALSCLALPFSNASVERTFSQNNESY